MSKTKWPELGTAVPQQNRPIRQKISRKILEWAGWGIEGDIPNIPKMVAVGAPHTSNWDLILTILYTYALGIDLSWMGKHTLFKPPFGWLFRKLGGIPVDRRAPRGTVGQMVDVLNQRESLILAIMPEGTRSKVREWRSGFYYIALEAGVPLAMVGLDFSQKRVVLGGPFWPTGDFDSDLPRFKSFYADFRGHNPNLE